MVAVKYLWTESIERLHPKVSGRSIKLVHPVHPVQRHGRWWFP